MDRLLSNKHLCKESHAIYTALIQRILQCIAEPIITIDWSPLCADQSWQLLRAAIPVGGRSLTLYEEVHPRSKLGHRKVQHQFLDKLVTMLPDCCRPVIVADSVLKHLLINIMDVCCYALEKHRSRCCCHRWYKLRQNEN